MFGRKSKGLIGLDIGSSSIKLVELKKKSADYELLGVAVEDLGQDTVVDGAIMDANAAANPSGSWSYRLSSSPSTSTTTGLGAVQPRRVLASAIAFSSTSIIC